MYACGRSCACAFVVFIFVCVFSFGFLCDVFMCFFVCLFALMAYLCAFFFYVCVHRPSGPARGDCDEHITRCVDAMKCYVGCLRLLLPSNWRFCRFCGLSQPSSVLLIAILFMTLLNAFSETAF